MHVSKQALYITIVVWLISLFAVWFICRPTTIEEPTPIEQKIDTIHHHMDSIVTIIDSSKVTITRIHHKYEKDYNTIIAQSTSDDYVFFTNYLRECGFSDSNNTDTIKADESHIP